MTTDPSHYLVPSVKGRTGSRHVKHLPTEDDDTLPKCANERGGVPRMSIRRVDDPIIADWRLCRYCDPEWDASPTGGSKALSQLLASDDVKTLADVQAALND